MIDRNHRTPLPEKLVNALVSFGGKYWEGTSISKHIGVKVRRVYISMPMLGFAIKRNPKTGIIVAATLNNAPFPVETLKKYMAISPFISLENYADPDDFLGFKNIGLTQEESNILTGLFLQLMHRAEKVSNEDRFSLMGQNAAFSTFYSQQSDVVAALNRLATEM